MEGVDIYDPVTNTIRATDAGKVAAWFLDSDYDGRMFCITQAFFPDSSAWDKPARASPWWTRNGSRCSAGRARCRSRRRMPNILLVEQPDDEIGV
jgi:adenine-specific DNA-methyltransferase